MGKNTDEFKGTTDLLVGVLSDGDVSDHLRKRIEVLASVALQEMEHIIQYGNPEMKLALYRSLLPAMIKALNKKEENDEIVQLRNQMSELIQEVRLNKGEVNDSDTNPNALIPDDTPTLRSITTSPTSKRALQ